jgi:hypothetical protein
MAIQIGKYKRPGIFIEEFDNSIITSPTVTGITTFVAGFSRKGPVNTPVLVQTLADLERIFGSLDRNLERKGSYLYRTVAKLLESNPVFVMNLLSTSDTLDLLEYKSVSTRTDKTNDIVREKAYRRFFDTTGFWKKDPESFINLATNDPGDDDRLLHFTNMSDKYITIFAFKTKLTGYNRPLLDFYGTAEKVPAYVNQLDFASDYMIDLIVVAGNWTNYSQLAVDNRWSQYFTTEGIDKNKLRDFTSDRGVTTLAYYEGLSLIPFFRDANGRNIFIETIVNNDTDRTGLFCAFNMDKFEKDFPSIMVDLTGNNLVVSEGLVNNGQTTIDFLSYNANLIELKGYEVTPLDIPGGEFGQNVFAMGASLSEVRQTWGGEDRSAFFSEEYINGVEFATSSVVASTSSITFGYDLLDPINIISGETSSYAYIVTSANKVLVNSGTGPALFTYSIAASSFPNNSVTASYTSVAYVSATTGDITVANGIAAGIAPSPSSGSDLIMNYFTYQVYQGQIITSSLAITDVGIKFAEDPSPLTFTFSLLPATNSSSVSFLYNGATISTATSSTNNLAVFITEIESSIVGATTSFTIGTSSTTITISVPGTLDQYNGNTVQLALTQGTGTIAVNPTTALTFTGGVGEGFNELVVGVDYTVTPVSPGIIDLTFLNTSSAANTKDYSMYRKIRLWSQLRNLFESSDLVKATMLKDLSTQEKFSLANATLVSQVSATSQNKSLRINLGLTTTPQYILDGNIVIYKIDNELTLGTLGLETKTTIAAPTASGVVAKYSQFYQDYYNGQINTGDYFHGNLVDPFSPVRLVFQNEGTFSYVIVDPGTNIDDTRQIYAPSSTSNLYPIQLQASTVAVTSLVDPISGTYYAGSYDIFQTDGIDLVNENLASIKFVWDFDKKHYLKMYNDSSENLFVSFVDSTLETSEAIDLDNDAQFQVWSNKRNYKQTVEIEEPTGYTPVANKILIKGSRYTEVKVGDYLEAFVENPPTNPEEKPRNLTRILTKRSYAADTTLVEITCDGPIEKYNINGDKQTLRYTSIDDYVSTYKGISLKGFRVREASMPDGTEARQNSILNLIAKGTSLAKALTNKEAIDFRYVVDSFGLGLIERSKQQLVDLCGDRLDCFGFLNMPSMKTFKNSTSPTFVNSEGVLQTSFIATGGNPESSPAFLYSFGDGRGVSSVGYFTPYLTVNDNGRPADVPPAMFVANAYLRKLNSGASSILPWTIVAGVTNGRITNIAGIEQNFSLEDIENLNGAQMNPIVFKRNRGYVIETENTAQTLYKSALSYIHVREVLIELERELSAMLLDFQWRFNTSEVRTEIKLRADAICERYVNRNGLYNYFNKCDEENNTADIIDNQIGVLDTYVEPIKGMAIIVNNITILRTGAISAGGFITV